MEKQAHISGNASNATIHPTLSVYLSGNFENQQGNAFNIQPVETESQKPNRCLMFFKKLHKNRLQTGSVTGGYLQLLVGGLHIAWGIWRLDFNQGFNEPWFTSRNGVFIFIILSFYVGAIIGGIMAAFIVNIWRKQAIYYLSGSIMVISNLTLIIWSTHEIGILFGRILTGLGYGLVYNVVVIHAGENSTKEIRGTVTSTINCILWSSTFIGSTLIATSPMGRYAVISIYRRIGIVGFAFSVLAMTYTMFWTHESVVFLLNRGKLGEALELLSTLRNEETETIGTSDDFEEMRLMIDHDKQENRNIFKNNNEKALGLMVTVKMLYVLSNNFLINAVMMMIFGALSPRILLGEGLRMSPVILTIVRFLSSVVQVLVVDLARRKLFINVFCTLAGVTLLSLQIMLISVSDFTNTSTLEHWVASALCIIVQLLFAFGIDPMHHVLLSEAFGTSKKNWSVTFVTTFENLAQIFFIGIISVDGIDYTFHIVLFVTIICMLGLFIILIVFLPETRGLSFKETRDVYRNIITRWPRCSRYQ